MSNITIQEWLDQHIQLFTSVNISSARLDAILILESTLKKSREWILAHSEQGVSDAELSLLEIKAEQRAKRVPLAYILGTKEFYGRTFLVNDQVLIPRPESESIIELLLTTDLVTSLTVIDIGTGSGCLAITAKLEIPAAIVIGSDISEDALQTARTNAELFKADVEFMKANLLPINLLTSTSIVLANLPYVPTSLVTSPEITTEPEIALFSGDDGLNLYRTFWQQAANLPTKPSCIIIESLSNQHKTLQQLASLAGYDLDKTLGICQRFTLSGNLL